MTLLNWLHALRRTQPITSAVVRRELHLLQQQHAVSVQQRDVLALDAVNDETAAARWGHLDDVTRQLTQRIQVLSAALPAAEAREAQAAKRIEEQTRAKRMQDFALRTQETQKFIDAVVASLPTGEVLTKARDLRDTLRTEANGLRTWCNEASVRRPLDPLYALVTAMQHRINRVSRARWAGGAPITLSGGPSPEELATATARVEALEGIRHEQ